MAESTSNGDVAGPIVIRAKPTKTFKPVIKSVNKIPDELLNDPLLNKACSALPSNYNFEVHKTVWRVRSLKANRVALQMPEGLIMFATTLADIIENFTDADTVIMGDVTYGACCIDDYTAKALDVDLLVHYGHSCLIPIDQTADVKVLYIFVDIKIDPSHFVETVKFNFPPQTHLAFVSTIQFVTTLHSVAKELKNDYTVTIPQCRPLSPGEILGCTAPRVNCDAIVYLGDGRFHLEAIMIANPSIAAFRYDPYEKKFTKEEYAHSEMLETRHNQITLSENSGTFGLILGTLGRQGSTKVLANLEKQIINSGKKCIKLLMSEVFPTKLQLFNSIDSFVQVACPRLSIDWGTAFTKPLLTPYELSVALKNSKWKTAEDTYPMDFYSNNSLGPWTPNFKSPIGCSGNDKKCDNCCGKK